MKFCNHIHLIPIGGLCNRMRVMASVASLSEQNQCHFVLHWNREEGLNAAFHRLFKPISGLDLKDDTLLSYIAYHQPSKYNLYLPKLFDKLFRRKAFYDINAERFEQLYKEFTGKNEELIVSTCSQLCLMAPLSQLFVPVDDIQQDIDNLKAQFGHCTYGVHIRRTDNKQSIQHSSLDKFYATLDQLFADEPEAKVYLCSDDKDVKQQFCERYNTDQERIITYAATLNRHSFKGIRDAVVELFALSSTKKIYGSYYSSYTDLASALHGAPLEVVK